MLLKGFRLWSPLITIGEQKPQQDDDQQVSECQEPINQERGAPFPPEEESVFKKKDSNEFQAKLYEVGYQVTSSGATLGV